MTLPLPHTLSSTDNEDGTPSIDRVQENFDELAKQFPIANANLGTRVVRGGTTATWAAAVASGVVTVTHGLGATPTAVVATFNAIGSGVHAWAEVGTVTSTTFQVQGVSNAAITATLGFYWVAYS
jgi:hypothetical protein